jgi:carboxyl-terminal processing protease
MQFHMRNRRISPWSVAGLVTVGILLGMRVETVISGDSLYEQIGKIKDVLSLVQKNYVDNVDNGKLAEAAINGMLGALDPHSVYISTSEMKRVEEDFRGSFEGIGVEFEILNDTITVISPIVGGPSEKLGILGGDRIVEIDGKNAVGLKTDEVPKKLRGPKGTHVQVNVVRVGVKEPMKFDIIRDKIPLYTVTTSLMWDDKTGYINLNRFASTTHDEMVQAIRKLKGMGMQRLVLDLRNNPGGYLDQAWKVADDFVPASHRIVYTKGRYPELGFDEELNASPGGIAEDLPVVVLVNKYSASASEIVSGAIQDNDRGIIVGTRTFGKGLVQHQFTLGDGSGVRITIARYYTPSGRLIQRPYEKGERDKYYAALQLRKELPGGENIDHTEEAVDSSELFHTHDGRVVFGGGGITPDYIVPNVLDDSLSAFADQVLKRNAIHEFIDSWLGGKREALEKKYESYDSFRHSFTVDAEMESSFRDFLKKKKIDIKEDQFAHDRDIIMSVMRGQIARSFWGYDGQYSVILERDQQFRKALTLFEEASRIAHLEAMR